MATYTYAGTSHALPNGIVLASIGPVPVGTGSTQRNGILLQYNQTKTRHMNVDDVAVLYFGRAKPAVETSGTVIFDIFNLSYGWPPTATALDGTTAVETALNAILADCRNGYLVQMQTSQGHGAAYNGIGYSALYGRLQDPAIDYPTAMPAWSVLTATFSEVG